MKKIIASTLLSLIILLLCGCSEPPRIESAPPVTTEPSAATIQPAATQPATFVPAPSPEPDETPVQPPVPIVYETALKVTGASLTDASGNLVQLRGISSHGLSWYPEYVNYDALLQMRDEWGCNVFRLAMYTDEYNGYCVGDDDNRARLLELIDDAVSDAQELGIYIIIDWHILSDGNPLQHKEQAADFFRTVSEKYADCEHVIYEICNEPNGGTTWQDVKSYAEEIIPIIRENTDAVILVGTPTWSQDIHLAEADPLDFENIMYTLHFYAATHKDDLRSRMLDAVSAGIPVFVSEFGICDASGNGAIDEAEADKWIEAMDSACISYVMWNLSNKDESAAMISSSCDKTSGFEPVDLSPAGQWFTSRMAEK